VSRKWKNWYRFEADKDTKGADNADSRDKVKHRERSDQLFLVRMKVAEQE